jgi:hypothetical protein
MTAKLISSWCAGALVVGCVFWLGGQPSWAAEELAVEGEATYIPAASPTTTPAPVPVAGQPPAAAPATAPATAPAPVKAAAPEVIPPPQGNKPVLESLQTAPPCVDEDEGAEFCGAPVCSPPGRFWLRADYLMWWTNGTRLPPLVTTSPQGTPVEQAGVLGLPTTTVLFGGDTVGNDMRSGYRTTLGMWLDHCHVWDLEFDYLSLGERANNFEMSSTGDPILMRPFFNVQTGAQAAELVAYPGIVQGTVTVNTKDYFQSAGAWLSRKLCACGSCGSCDPCEEMCEGDCGGLRSRLGSSPCTFGCRTDLLVGFRYANLSDFVGVTENLLITDETAAGTSVVIHDNFRARNDFYGSELGLRTQIYRGRWSLEVLTKIAMGNNHQTITIDGQTINTPAGGPSQTYESGILAGDSSTNAGVFQRDTFTVIPQVGLELGYQVTRHLRAYVGYDLLYWATVARAADQIDLNLDPRNFPPVTQQGLPFPQFPGKTDSFWAQGIHLGTELRF